MMDFVFFIIFCLSPAAQAIHLQAYLHTCLVFRPTRCWISPCGHCFSLLVGGQTLLWARGSPRPNRASEISSFESSWTVLWLLAESRWQTRRDTMWRPRPVSELPDRARSFIIIHFENKQGLCLFFSTVIWLRVVFWNPIHQLYVEGP